MKYTVGDIEQAYKEGEQSGIAKGFSDGIKVGKALANSQCVIFGTSPEGTRIILVGKEVDPVKQAEDIAGRMGFSEDLRD